MAVFKNTPRLKVLPDDNIKRVVYAHGGILFNSINTSSPLVEVLFVEVENSDGVEQLTGRHFVKKISISDIDSVKYGAQYIGNRAIDERWTGFQDYTQGVSFNFNFEQSQPDTIRFKDRKANGDYYIKYNKLSFGMLSSSEKRATFLDSKLTRLVSDEGVTVLIPSLEVLVSILVPVEKVLRSQLFTYPLDDIINFYLNDYYVDYEDKIYALDFKNRMKNRSSAAFLAYLAMNNVSRSRLSKISMSVFEGSPNQVKHPEVLPYHPTNLSITVDGMWIDEDTFFCFRVNKVELPSDFKIKRNIEKKIKIGDKVEKPDPGNGEGGDLIEKDPEADPDSFELIGVDNPGEKEPTVYIKSEVEVFCNDDLFVDSITEKEVDEPIYIKVNEQMDGVTGQEVKEGEDPQTGEVSSGEGSYARDSKNIKKLREKECLIENARDRVLQSSVLKNIVKTLDMLKNDEFSILQNFSYPDANGIASSKGTLFDFSAFKSRKDNKRWSYKVYDWENKIFIGRGALIVKIMLTNGKHAYLLEIERRNENEAFSGQLFNTINGALTRDDIEQLLLEIAKHSGKSSERFDKKGLQAIRLNSVDRNIPYIHIKDKSNSLYVNMLNELFKTHKDHPVFK